MHLISKPTLPFEGIHIDITGKLETPNEQEYVVVDSFTKYALLRKYVLLRYTDDKST